MSNIPVIIVSFFCLVILWKTIRLEGKKCFFLIIEEDKEKTHKHKLIIVQF